MLSSRARADRGPGRLVAAFGGALLSRDSKDALWARFCAGAPRRQRRSVERYSRDKRALGRWPSALGSISLGINQKTARQVKGLDFSRRSADSAEEAPFIGPVRGGRGRGDRLPKAYPAAARRLPLRVRAYDPTPDALVSSPVPAASWNLAPATGRRRSFAQAQVQGSPIGYFPIDIELGVHLRDFVDAYNFARRLKTLKGLTSYAFICKT
jgi:hypothetical protein